MATYHQILSDIKNRKFAPVYLLMGDEPYYIDLITSALESSVVEESEKEFDQNVLYGADISAGNVLESVGQFPLWSDFRLVILKEAQSMARAKAELDKLAPYIANINPKTILCIAYKDEKLGATSDLMKAIKKNTDVVVFESPKIKEYKLKEVIKDHCLEQKIKIEDAGIDFLITNIGASLSSLFSEIEKLRVAAGKDHKTITTDLVCQHIGVSKEFNNFELINALSRRDYFQTLRILKYFEENPKSNPTPPIVGMIFNFYQRCLIASFNADKSERGLLEALQLKSSYQLTDIRTGLRNYNARQLVEAIHAIRDFDTRSKGIGSMQKEYPLMRELVCRLLTL